MSGVFLFCLRSQAGILSSFTPGALIAPRWLPLPWVFPARPVVSVQPILSGGQGPGPEAPPGLTPEHTCKHPGGPSPVSAPQGSLGSPLCSLCLVARGLHRQRPPDARGRVRVLSSRALPSGQRTGGLKSQGRKWMSLQERHGEPAQGGATAMPLLRPATQRWPLSPRLSTAEVLVGEGSHRQEGGDSGGLGPKECFTR